jgi:hypothetical protein
MEIDGEEWGISPEAWRSFEEWYGDKAYRHADVVQDIEWAVRNLIASKLSDLKWQMRACDGTYPDEYSTREIRDVMDMAIAIVLGGGE